MAFSYNEREREIPEVKCWYPQTVVYDPIKAGSIDSTDILPHDAGVVRAVNSTYKSSYKAKGNPLNTLFIGRLSLDTTEKDLEHEFCRYGKMIALRLVKDIVTGLSKRYAFIEYETFKMALNAYVRCKSLVLNNSEIFVDFECERLLPGWKPRRLGGGYGGQKQSGQLRFGGRIRSFRPPIGLIESKRSKTYEDENPRTHNEENRKTKTYKEDENARTYNEGNKKIKTYKEDANPRTYTEENRKTKTYKEESRKYSKNKEENRKTRTYKEENEKTRSHKEESRKHNMHKEEKRKNRTYKEENKKLRTHKEKNRKTRTHEEEREKKRSYKAESRKPSTHKEENKEKTTPTTKAQHFSNSNSVSTTYSNSTISLPLTPPSNPTIVLPLTPPSSSTVNLPLTPPVNSFIVLPLTPPSHSVVSLPLTPPSNPIASFPLTPPMHSTAPLTPPPY